MPYIEVPIIGSGAHGKDPYRASIRVRGKSAVIPSNPDGSPKFTTCLVWIPDKYETEIDRSITRIPPAQARNLISQMDPKANPDRLEQKRS